MSLKIGEQCVAVGPPTQSGGCCGIVSSPCAGVPEWTKESSPSDGYYRIKTKDSAGTEYCLANELRGDADPTKSRTTGGLFADDKCDFKYGDKDDPDTLLWKINDSDKSIRSKNNADICHGTGGNLPFGGIACSTEDVSKIITYAPMASVPSPSNVDDDDDDDDDDDAPSPAEGNWWTNRNTGEKVGIVIGIVCGVLLLLGIPLILMLTMK